MHSNLSNEPFKTQNTQVNIFASNKYASKRKYKATLTTTKCALIYFSHSEAPKAPTPQDPLHNPKTINYLGSSLACAGSQSIGSHWD